MYPAPSAGHGDRRAIGGPRLSLPAADSNIPLGTCSSGNFVERVATTITIDKRLSHRQPAASITEERETFMQRKDAAYVYEQLMEKQRAYDELRREQGLGKLHAGALEQMSRAR
jgi:hypothetical protein